MNVSSEVRQTRWPWQGCLMAVVGVALTLAICLGGIVALYLIFPPPPVTILAVGLDSPLGESDSTELDGVLLVQIHPAEFRVSVLSIPRHTQLMDTGAVYTLGTNYQALQTAIETRLGIAPDYVIQFDYDAFTQLIDAVGGVRVYVERVIEDDAYPAEEVDSVQSIRFESGWQVLDGERALIYIRTRQDGGDTGRAERQQAVLSALAEALNDPGHWPDVWPVLSNAVQTDLRLWDMLLLAPPVVLSQGRFEQLTINDEYAIASDDVLVPDTQSIRNWLQMTRWP